MKNIIKALFLSILILGSSALAGPLVGNTAIATGEIPADGAWHQFGYVNSTGHTLDIRLAEVVSLVSGGTVSLVKAYLQAGANVLVFGEKADNSAVGLSSDTASKDFGQNYISLPAGSGLTLYVFAAAKSGSPVVAYSANIWTTADY